MMRWPSLLFNARPMRASLETLCMGTVFWSILLLLQHDISSFLWQLVVELCIGLGCMLLCALRLQLPDGSKRHQSTFDSTICGIVNLVMSSMELAITLVLLHGVSVNTFWQRSNRPLITAVLALTLNLLVFILFRFGVRLCLYWNQLRRKQLLWALTHAHVMI